MQTVRKQQLASIGFDSANQRPQRYLVGKTSTTSLVLDLRAQVDIAIGGGADGVLNVEQPLGLLPNIRIFDGSSDPIVAITAAELRQLTNRRSFQVSSGLALANAGIQVATQIRQHLVLHFADPWSINPIETALRPRDPKNFYLELEWPGTTNQALADSLITGGTRVITVSALAVDVLQVHDPVAFLRTQPLFVPRIKTQSFNAPATVADLALDIKSSAKIRSAMLHSLAAGVSTEAIINRLTLRDDATLYRESVLARTWHEDEQVEFGGVDDVAGVAMAYFFADFAQFGRLGQVFDPGQGGNPKWVLDVTGAANRIIRVVTVELERVSGLTAEELPAGLDS